MDPSLQQHPLSHFTSFVQKTPIPSQLPNRLSHPPPKVSLQTSPEVCNRNKLSQNLHVAGKKSTSPLVNSPTNIVSPVNSFAKGILVPMKNRPPSHGYNLGSPVSVTTARENTGPQQNMMQSGKGWFSPPEVVLTSLTQTSAETQNRPKILGSTSHQHQKNLNNHLPSCLSGRDHEPMILSSNSGKSSDVSQRQESNKGQQHDQTRSSKSTIPVMDLNNTSAKRRREGEPCLKNTKKPCLKGTNHGTTEVTKLTPGTSPVSSLDPQPSPRSSSVLESSPEPLDKLLKSESPYPRLSSVCKPSRLSSTCSKKTRSTGAKQGFITTENNVIKLRLSSTLSKESPKKQHGENLKKEESSSVKVNEESGKPPHVGLVSKISDNKDHTVPVKTGSKLNGSTLKPASKQSISSLSCSTPERSKSNRVQKPVALLNDIEQLFTPDPKVYIVKPPRLTPKSKMEEETIKSSILKKGSSPPSSSSPTVTPVSLPVKQPQLVASSQTSTLTLCLESLKLEKHNTGSKDRAIRRSSDNSSIRQSTENSKPQPSLTPKPKTNEGLCGSETDTSASVHKTSTSCTKSPQLKEKENNENKEVKEEDSIVVDLDLDLSISYGIDITQSTDSSEEEPLISFQEIMERVTKPPDTPQKEAFSEPSTPGCHSSRSKTCPQPSTTKPEVYKNSLDQMLKEINSSKKAKELEEQLLSACNIDLLRLAEYEEAEENQVEITTEHQEFLHHVSLMSAAIREVPPGEEIFNLEKFGQIFNQDTLQLRQCFVEPQGTSQKTLLWSSPAQLKLHLNIGLFEEAYCSSPCPAQVTRFLFKMMSVHRERIISDKILQALCAIACSAAYQIVNNESQQFEVWVPSLADVTLVFMNMGAAFVTLFPFESLQPLFTEGDLLLDVYIDSESSCKKEEINFPKHSCTNILKYLSYCVGLCTHAYSDDELLLLLTVVGRISLETRQIPWPSEEVSCLLYKMVNNIRDWSSMLPRVCKALTDLTDDHHNMCLLVQLLPDSTRGKQLRRHLSMCYISKLLDGSCTYRPIQQELQLAELRPYLPQMQPSALLQSLQQKDKEEDMATLDQQAYYLCYSLLTLTNEASNLLVFKTDQKAQLLVLSSELETHVKCDIRESEKCLYRSKVKDLVARIYTKWQMLLQKTRPLNGKLYDYWQPVEAFRNTNVDGEEHFIEDDDDDEEATIIHENDIETGKNEEDEQEKMEVKEDEVVENLEDDTKTREATVAVEQVADDFNQTAPLMLCPAVDEKIDPGLKECTDMEHETAGGEEISPPDVIM